MKWPNLLKSVARNLDIILVLFALFISSGALFVISNFDISKLNAFGPTARIYLEGIHSGLLYSTIILLVSLLIITFFKKQSSKLIQKIENYFVSFSEGKQYIFILVVCLLFVFISHGGNVINGYFNMDDFEIVGLNHSLPFSQSILTPHGNDHAFPLFIAEMKFLDILFGLNPISYNIFFFILFSLIPFFVYLIFKQLNINNFGFLIFLIVFAGSPGWVEVVTGFYIMTVYPQILLFFTIMMWSYLAWENSRKNIYIAILSISTALALTSDTSGIWVIPSILLFIFLTSNMGLLNTEKNEELS